MTFACNALLTFAMYAIVGPRWPLSIGSDLSDPWLLSKVWCQTVVTVSPALSWIIFVENGFFSGFAPPLQIISGFVTSYIGLIHSWLIFTHEVCNIHIPVVSRISHPLMSTLRYSIYQNFLKYSMSNDGSSQDSYQNGMSIHPPDLLLQCLDVRVAKGICTTIGTGNVMTILMAPVVWRSISPFVHNAWTCKSNQFISIQHICPCPLSLHLQIGIWTTIDQES